jgi:hypothetical protein
LAAKLSVLIDLKSRGDDYTVARLGFAAFAD